MVLSNLSILTVRHDSNNDRLYINIFNEASKMEVLFLFFLELYDSVNTVLSQFGAKKGVNLVGYFRGSVFVNIYCLPPLNEHTCTKDNYWA